jgi:hypothetical protein
VARKQKRISNGLRIWRERIADALWFGSDATNSLENRETVLLWRELGFDLQHDVLPVLRNAARRARDKDGLPPQQLGAYAVQVKDFRARRLRSKRRAKSA